MPGPIGTSEGQLSTTIFHALHDFDEVACRIFRRQQAKCGARAGLYGFHVTRQLAVRIGIDPNLNRLAGSHVLQLRFLVVCNHPNFVGHEHHQALPRGDVGAFCP